MASSTSEMAKDAKYDRNVSSTGSVFFPLVVETLGLWTDSSVSLLCCIDAHTTLRSRVSRDQAIPKFITMPKCYCTNFPSCLWLASALHVMPVLPLNHVSSVSVQSGVL